jgi:hypothetical protein
MLQHILGLNLGDAVVRIGQGAGEIVPYLAVMRRLQSQANEIGNLELAFMRAQAAEIEIWLHRAIVA